MIPDLVTRSDSECTALVVFYDGCERMVLYGTEKKKESSSSGTARSGLSRDRLCLVPSRFVSFVDTAFPFPFHVRTLLDIFMLVKFCKHVL